MKHKKRTHKAIAQPGGKPISFIKRHNEDTKYSTLSTAALKKFERQIFVSKKKAPISRKEFHHTANSLLNAQKAIFVEKKFIENQRKSQTLLISFPDQELNPLIVQSYSQNFDSVKFINSSIPRFCYVQLKPGSNVDDEIERISKIPFQNGYLKAKLKPTLPREAPPVPKEIDPTTLYVGNLPSDISVNEVKNHFEKSVRIEMGYSLKKKWRRYALVHYQTSEEAMYAFAINFDSHIRTFSLIVRFHRLKNWRVLQDIERENETMKMKIKQEIDDESYETILKKSHDKHRHERKNAMNEMEDMKFNQSSSRCPIIRYPIARPFIDTTIVKEEPVSPMHTSKEAIAIPTKSNQNDIRDQCVQLYEYMLIVQKQSREKQQVQQRQTAYQHQEQYSPQTVDFQKSYHMDKSHLLEYGRHRSLSPASTHSKTEDKQRNISHLVNRYKSPSVNWCDKLSQLEIKCSQRAADVTESSRRKRKRRWKLMEASEMTSHMEMPTSSDTASQQSRYVYSNLLNVQSRPHSKSIIPSLLNIPTVPPPKFKLAKEQRKERTSSTSAVPYSHSSHDYSQKNVYVLPHQKQNDIDQAYESSTSSSNRKSKRNYSYHKSSRKK